MATLDAPIPDGKKHRLIRFGRSRISWILLSCLMFVSVAFGYLQQRTSLAAVDPTLSGRLVDANTGFGIPNVTLSLCHDITVVTNSNGEWSAQLAQYTSFCVLYQSGAPSTVLSTTAVNLPSEVAGRNLYQYQLAGVDCYHNTADTRCYLNSQTWDRSVDSGYDLKMALAVPYVPPTPAPTPVPTPTPKPTATPVPGATTQPSSGATAGSTGKTTLAPKPGSAADKAANDIEAPTPPAGLKAVSAETNAVVTLSWEAAHDNVAVTNYELDRTVDGEQWSTLSHDIKALGYQDTTVAYGLTYSYRLRAVDAKGNSSGYITAQAKTPQFVTNTSTSTSSSFTSDDGSAIIFVEAGTFGQHDAQCSVILGGWNSLKLDSGSAILAGPYQLLCKDPQGNVITNFAHNVRWTITPRTSELKLSAPQVFRIGADGRPALVKGADYDQKAKAFTYTQSSNERIIILASQQASSNVIVAIIIVGVLIFVLAGATFISLQRKRIAMYRDYLRDKYYNL